jgi:hypothetical protein
MKFQKVCKLVSVQINALRSESSRNMDFYDTGLQNSLTYFLKFVSLSRHFL